MNLNEIQRKNKNLPAPVKYVSQFLQKRQHPYIPIMLDDAVHTAQAAANYLSVEMGQIAKSIVFRDKRDDGIILVVASGDRQICEKKLRAALNLSASSLGKANADFVKEKTGFSIGGVAPVAHALPAIIVLDQELQRYDELWTAAGHPNSVFKLTPQQLILLTESRWSDVTE